jgi:hypothetical protein
MISGTFACGWRRQLTLMVLLAVGCTSVTAAQTVVLPGTELLQNPYARAAVNLDGDWHVIPDPYENGYYNHRFEPRKDGYFLARQQKDPGELVEYDFRTSQVLQVPGDWNSQDDRFFLYEGTMWYFRTFDLQPKEDTRYLLYFGAANYFAEAWLNGGYLVSVRCDRTSAAGRELRRRQGR